jgi:hypothetical protein
MKDASIRTSPLVSSPASCPPSMTVRRMFSGRLPPSIEIASLFASWWSGSGPRSFRSIHALERYVSPLVPVALARMIPLPKRSPEWRSMNRKILDQHLSGPIHRNAVFPPGDRQIEDRNFAALDRHPHAHCRLLGQQSCCQRLFPRIESHSPACVRTAKAARHSGPSGTIREQMPMAVLRRLQESPRFRAPDQARSIARLHHTMTRFS